MPQGGTITTHESGVDIIVEWKIEDFFNLPQWDGAKYDSPEFSFGGERWFLSILPNGSSGRWNVWILPNGPRRDGSSGHVDLGLSKCKSGRSIKQSFSLSLKTAKGEKYNKQNCTKDFGRIYPENYHELLRFTRRSELTMRRSELVPKGVLTVVCTMRNLTTAGNTSNSGSAEYCPSDSPEYCPSGSDSAEYCLSDFPEYCPSDSPEYCPSDSPEYCPSDSPEYCPSDSPEYCLFDYPEYFPSDSPEYCPSGSDSAEYCPSDSAESSSDSGECCHKCSNCLDIVKKQKKLLEDLENQKDRSEAEKYPEHHFVEVPTQNVKASIQTVEASTQTVEVSTQTVEASIETVEEKCETCASGSSIGFHDDELRNDLKELFLKKEDCDIIIKVKDSEFPAHRVILKARSPVFASTFRHDMKENTTGVLEIEDCDSSTFSGFLCFLYCGDVGIISQENVFGLFTTADKYQVLKLRAKCLEFMKMNITVDTFCETLTLALRHSETELIKLCTDYFKKNIPKIIVTVKWQIFLAENPTESNELLVKCFVPNSSCGN